MNELISSERGILIDFYKTRRQRSGKNYYVDPKSLERSILKTLNMAQEDIHQLGLSARAWYENNDRYFHKTIITAIEDLLLRH